MLKGGSLLLLHQSVEPVASSESRRPVSGEVLELLLRMTGNLLQFVVAVSAFSQLAPCSILAMGSA